MSSAGSMADLNVVNEIVERKRRIDRAKKTWHELDKADWREEGDDDPYNVVEAFFHFIYTKVT